MRKATNLRLHRFEQLQKQLSDKLRAAGVSQEIALANLPQARKRIYARQYGKKKS